MPATQNSTSFSLFSRFFRVIFHLARLTFFFILLNIYSCPSSFAQSKTDSLITALSLAKEDTNKVNLLNALGWEYKYSNPDTSIVLLNQALAHTKKINWQKGKANTLRNIGWYHYSRGNYPEALKHYSEALSIYNKLEDQKGISATLGSIGIVYNEQGDYPKALEHYFKALEIAKELGNKRNISAWLGSIGNVYRNQGDYPKALEHYFKALEIAQVLGDKSGVAIWLGNIGHVYRNQSDYPKALEHYFRALEIDKELGNKSGIAGWLGNIGIVYWSQGDYPKALEHYFKALEIATGFGNKSYISAIVGNIGIVYHAQGDYPKALEHYFKALEIAKELGNKSGIAIWHGNIGVVYRNQGDYPKALEHYFKALEIDKALGDNSGIAIRLGNIGIVYDEQGDYPKALEHYFKALEIAKGLGNKSGIARWLGNIGALFTTQKRYAEAEDYLNRSLSVAEEIGSIDDIRVAHQNLSKLFGELAEKSGKREDGRQKTEDGRRKTEALHSKALEHYEKYLQASDTIFNEEKSKSMGKMEGRHEFALAEMERERIKNEELRIKNAEIAHRNKIQYSIIFIVIFLVVLTAIFILFAKFKISQKLKSGSVFITLLLLFEFILLISDPEIENITSSDPVFKLGINALLAIVFYFMQVMVVKILSVNKLTTPIPTQHFSSFLIFLLVLPLLSAFAPLQEKKEVSRKGAMAQSTTNNQPINLSTYQPINLSTYSKTDSLKTLLSTYQNQYTELRNTNKLKEAYETIQKYGVIKDTLQQQEKTQELNRLNEKLNLEKQQVIEKIKKEELAKIEVAHKNRINNLKYSGILIFIILLFVMLIVFNRKPVVSEAEPSTLRLRSWRAIVNQKFLSAGLFVSFLLLFEFIIVLTDPYIEQYTGGAPAWKLGFNMALAILIFPLHHYLEEKMRGRLWGGKR